MISYGPSLVFGVSIGGSLLPRRRAALHIFDPVQHHVDRRFGRWFALPRPSRSAGHQAKRRRPGPYCLREKPAYCLSHNRRGFPGGKCGLRCYVYGHHLVPTTVEEFSVARPHWLHATISRDLPFPARLWIRAERRLPAGLIHWTCRLASARQARKLRRTLVEWSLTNRAQLCLP